MTKGRHFKGEDQGMTKGEVTNGKRRLAKGVTKVRGDEYTINSLITMLLVN